MLTVCRVPNPLVTWSQRQHAEPMSDLHLGGFVGYSAWRTSVVIQYAKKEVDVRIPSGKVTVSLKRPPSQIVFSFPGMPHSQTLRSSTPWAFFCGLA